ncbi:protein SSUH2 homolog [Saccoglossus kowalevskii]
MLNSYIQHILLFEHIAGFVVPPPPLTLPAETERPTEEYSSASNISEDDARAAMIQFVSEHCCYGSKPAKEMEISSILPSSALHYQLETFSESRETSRDFVHYKGRKPLMGPMHGMAPPPWNIMCSPTNLFQDEVKELEVPYTAFAARCHNCDGRGFNRCYRCHGRGRVRCGSCHASGHTWRTDAEGQRHQETCHSCHGSGRKWCYTCGGDGRITCASCKGYRMLKHYVKLTVRLQRLRAVPVSEVAYKWEDTNTRFWIYGNEHKVHAPDYPQQCCWGCSIL